MCRRLVVYLRKLESWTNAACNAKKCYKPLPGLQTLRAVRSPYLSRPHLFADLVPDLDLGSRLISVRRCGRFHMSHAFCSKFLGCQSKKKSERHVVWVTSFEVVLQAEMSPNKGSFSVRISSSHFTCPVWGLLCSSYPLLSDRHFETASIAF